MDINRRTSFDLTYLDEPLALPSDVADKVQEHWEQRVTDAPWLFNGPALVLVDVEGGQNLQGVVRQSTYAHYSASAAGILPPEHAAMSAYVSALILTADGSAAMVKMAERTGYPGRLQLPGGGLGEEDVQNGIVNVLGAAERELAEELGIAENLFPWCTFRDPKAASFGFAFKGRTERSKDELVACLSSHNERQRAAGQDPEIERLVFSAGASDFEPGGRLAGHPVVSYIPGMWSAL